MRAAVEALAAGPAGRDGSMWGQAESLPPVPPVDSNGAIEAAVRLAADFSHEHAAAADKRIDGERKPVPDKTPGRLNEQDVTPWLFRFRRT
jgi:hypothetical protein